MTKTIFALLLAVSAAPAVAETQASFQASTVVHTADLDLTTASGQRRLDLRLRNAAAEVCGTASPSDLEGQNRARRCRKEAVASVAAERDQRIAAASSQPIEVAAR